MKLSLLYEDIDAKTKLLLKKYYNNDQTKIKEIELAKQADPTNGKKYLDWIVKLLSRETIRLPEDVPNLLETLTQFDKLKNRGDFTDEKDINKYNSYGELARTLDKYTEESKRQTKIKTGRGLLVPEGAKVIYQDNTYIITKITDVKTAIKVSTRTKWCTANPEPAEYYLSEGPLYVAYKDEERYALIHYESNQVMDIYDSPLSVDYKYNLYEIINKADNRDFPVDFVVNWAIHTGEPWPEREQQILRYARPFILIQYCQIRGPWPEAERILINNPNYAVIYAYEVLKRRWPEAEEIIKTRSMSAVHYATKVIQGPWPKGERVIITSPHAAVLYAKEALQRRWPEAEPIILSSQGNAYQYARDVIKGRWPEYEAKLPYYIFDDTLGLELAGDDYSYIYPYIHMIFTLWGIEIDIHQFVSFIGQYEPIIDIDKVLKDAKAKFL